MYVSYYTRIFGLKSIEQVKLSDPFFSPLLFIDKNEIVRCLLSVVEYSSICTALSEDYLLIVSVPKLHRKNILVHLRRYL